MMKGAYDNLSQETWNSADDNMPAEYVKAIVAQTLPPKRPLPKTDEELKARYCELDAIKGRLAGREMPRFGQPSFDAPLVEWYCEYRYRLENPLWYEREYYFTDDGDLIHERRL